jgi:hypothetical protein
MDGDKNEEVFRSDPSSDNFPETENPSAKDAKVEVVAKKEKKATPREDFIAALEEWHRTLPMPYIQRVESLLDKHFPK